MISCAFYENYCHLNTSNKILIIGAIISYSTVLKKMHKFINENDLFVCGQDFPTTPAPAVHVTVWDQILIRCDVDYTGTLTALVYCSSRFVYLFFLSKNDNNFLV